MAEDPSGWRTRGSLAGCAPAPVLADACGSDTTSAPCAGPRGGLYAGHDGTYRVLLFVDLDPERGVRRVSGDFFRGAPTTRHIGWFYLPAPRVVTHEDAFELKGMGRYTFAAAAPLVSLRIPRSPLGTATERIGLHFLRPDLAVGAHYECTPYVADADECLYAPPLAANVAPFPGPRRRLGR